MAHCSVTNSAECAPLIPIIPRPPPRDTARAISPPDTPVIGAPMIGVERSNQRVSGVLITGSSCPRSLRERAAGDVAAARFVRQVVAGAQLLLPRGGGVVLARREVLPLPVGAGIGLLRPGVVERIGHVGIGDGHVPTYVPAARPETLANA